MPMKPVYYAIGDVHGEAERLGALHEAIRDHHESRFPARARTVVHLGDYIDRGPDSCGVVDRIIALEAEAAQREDFNVISLMGNHERMMLDAAEDETGGSSRLLWLRNGGDAAIESYIHAGRAHGTAMVDEAHLAWMASLPHIWTAEDGRLIFVHAGVDPITYPEDTPDIHLWTRSRRFFESQHWDNVQLEAVRIIHGHTPTANGIPDVSPDGRRINVDTAAVYGGRLTAAVISSPDAPVTYLWR